MCMYRHAQKHGHTLGEHCDKSLVTALTEERDRTIELQRDRTISKHSSLVS